MRSARDPLLLALGSLVLFAAVYAFAFGTETGLDLDNRALVRDFRPDKLPRVHDATRDLLRTIDVSSILLLGSAIVVLGLFRRRLDLALGAVAVIVCANVATQLMKPFLGQLDPLHVEGLRPLGTFPSGHATVAMSLALALLFVAPPPLLPLVGLLGGAYAAGVGIALVALGWHYPSDVGGGFLVASFCAGLALAVVRMARRRSGPARVHRKISALAAGLTGIVLVGAFVVVAAVALQRQSLVWEYGRSHTLFFVAVAALSALSLMVVGAFVSAHGPHRA